MKNESIQNYILKSPRNLTIAAAVGEAWPEAREKLVLGFLDRLDARLKTKLKGWQSEREQNFYETSWASYNLWKPTWRNEYGLGLMWVDYGKEMVFGVWRDSDNFGRRQHCGELLNAVKAIESSAKSDNWWEARIRMDRPASDWCMPEVLWEMHTDKKFLDAVALRLLKVVEVSEAIINRLAQHYNSKTKARS